MRFAYIDSQGNEVPIPSVDALALRIELGAVKPDTQLYDAQADRWGPANTHEIFNTLVREAEEGDFVAPPPVAPPPAAEEAEAPAEAPEEPAEVPEEPVADLGALAPEEPEPEKEAPPAWDLSDDLGEEAAEAPAAETPAAPESGGDDLGLDLTLADAGATPAPEPPAEEEADEGGGFDFGDMGSLELDVEEEEEEEQEEEPKPAGADDVGGGMLLEEPLADQMDFAAPAGGDDDLALETPMSEFDADAPPAWMEQDAPEADDSMAFESPAVEEREAPAAPPPGAAEAEERPEEAERPKREPRSRPSPPRRRSQRSFAGPAIGIVVIAAVAGGGWFGWNALRSGGSGDAAAETPALPPVTIPDIPAELLPTMRDLGEDALAATIADLDALQEAFDLPVEPRNDWLAGVYLAQASQFPDVEEFWLGIEAFVDSVRVTDTQVFHAKYVEALAEAGIEGDTAGILLERADSGFLATRDDRFEAYAQMDDLVNAALNLHDFLLQNEQSIEYTPAAGGMSQDPVLEAVPATDELGDQMWGMVDDITEALDVLGTLDRVTTERLLAVLFDRIRRAGFQ